MKYLIMVIMISSAFSCKMKNNADEIIINNLNKKLQEYNTNLEYENNRLLRDFETRKKEPAEKVCVTKMDSIANIYNTILNNEMETLKMNSIEEMNWNIAYENFEKAKQKLITINTEATNEFKKLIDTLKFLFNPNETKIKELSKEQQLSNLLYLKNNYLSLKNKLLDYWSSKCTLVVIKYDYFSPLLSQNTTHLRKGELLEIISGIGVFASNPNLKMIINGEKFEGDSYSLTSKIIANKKPGKYTLPVQIQYKDFNGNIQTKTENIYYVIDK